MKGFGIFLAVLIFLMAAVSAVFSFFLFEKRSQLVDGWNFMGGEINKTAAALDQNSGTGLGAKLTQENLSTVNYAQMQQALPELAQSAETLVRQRDELADALAQVAKNLGLTRQPAAAELKKVAAYKNPMNQIVTDSKNYYQHTESLLAAVAVSARLMKTEKTVTAALLRFGKSDWKRNYQAIDDRINTLLRRDQEFTDGVTRIARAFGVTRALPLDPAHHVATLEAVRKDADALKRRANELNAQLTEARNRIKNLEQVLKERNGQISDLTAQRDRKNRELFRICQALGLEAPRVPIDDGSAEALQMVRTQEKGKVIEIDRKFGFLVISLGKNTRVEEQFGNRINYVNPLIQEDMVVTVARNMPSGKADFVCRVKLVKVDDNCSIGELVDPQTAGKPQVGDLVFLDDEEIAKILKNRK